MKHRIELQGVVQEMTRDTNNLALPSDIDIKSLTEGDKNPMFVTVEVMRPTVSNNKNVWTSKILESIKEQIVSKKPYGYAGHLTEEERGSKKPEPLTTWITAEIIQEQGEQKLIAKGYVLPTAKALRAELKAAKAINKRVPVSVYGQGKKSTYDSNLGGYEITAYNLESIDWARDQGEGIETAGTISITKEETMNRKDVIASLTKEELQTERPDLVPTENKVISEMTNTLGVEESKLSETISEMKKENETLKSDLENKDKEMVTLQEMVNINKIDTELKKRVKSLSARAVVRRMVISEIKSGKSVDEAIKYLETEEGKAIIQESTITLPEDHSNDKNKSSLNNKYLTIS